MDSDLDALEQKIADIARLVGQLRAENLHLRQQLAALENDKRLLHERMEAARARVEALLARIPEPLQ
jgi:uncharacterized protein (TIGR02449 family)